MIGWRAAVPWYSSRATSFESRKFWSQNFMGFSDGHGIEAAIHDEFGTSDETAGVGGEQQRRAGQFVRFAKTRHGRVGHDGRDALGVEHLAVLFGGEKARHQDVNAHALRGPFAG